MGLTKFLKAIALVSSLLTLSPASVLAGKSQYLWIECEECSLSPGARALVEPYCASAQSLVEVPEIGEGIEITVSLSSGRYFLWLRSTGDNQGDPLFGIEVNGEEIATGSSNEGLGRIFFWQGPYPFSARGEKTRIRITALSSGRSAFPGRWDVFLITDNNNFVPPPGIPCGKRYTETGEDPGWPILMPTSPEVHPSLLFDRAEIALIRERIQKEPYRRGWFSIREYADRARDNDLTGPVKGYITTGSRMIACCAFAYLMTDEQPYLEKAKEGLLHAFVWMDPEHHHRDRWYALSGVLYDCLRAYDMIQPYLSDEENQKIRRILAKKTEEGYRAILERNRHVTSHNKLGRTAAAVGLGALVLNDYSSAPLAPSGWLKCALEYLALYLNTTISPEGINYEGPSYSNYPSQLILPFFAAYRRKTGVDLFQHPVVAKWLRWHFSLQQPSGLLPAGPEDGHESHFNFSYVPEDHPDAAMFQQAEKNNRVLHPWRRQRAIDPIILAKDSVENYEPDVNASVFFSGGQAVFRQDWNKDAVWGFLMNNMGLSHKQLDTGNFIMWAYGRKFLIDGGYGPKGYDSVRYKEGHHHNLIEVNGIFPDRDDSFPMEWEPGLRKAMETSFWAYAEGPNSLYTRMVAFPYHRYFWVIDELDRPGTFKAYWHGLGKLIRHSSTTYSWQQDDAGLLAEFLTPRCKTSTTQSPHSHRWGQEELHPVVIVEGRGKKILTVFYPRRKGEKAKVFSLRKKGRWIGGRVKDVNGVGTLLLSEREPGELLLFKNVETDGDMIFFQEKDERLDYFFAREAKFWKRRGFCHFASDLPVTIAVKATEGAISGYVSGPRRYFLSFPSPTRPSYVSYQGISWPVRYRQEDEMVDLLIMSGSGPFEILK